MNQVEQGHIDGVKDLTTTLNVIAFMLDNNVIKRNDTLSKTASIMLTHLEILGSKLKEIK